MAAKKKTTKKKATSSKKSTKKTVKKKATKKKVAKKNVVKKTTPISIPTKALPKKAIIVRVPKKVKYTPGYLRSRINLVLSNLTFFLILFLVSILLYSVAGSKAYQDVFYLFTIIFGFVGIAFLIALLVFVIIRLRSRL